MNRIIIITLAVLTLGITACKKELDHPPINELTDGQIITLDTLLAMYEGEDIYIDNEVSLYATVTMDEIEGNVYKNVFIQDGNSAVNMRMTSSSDLAVGDYIRVNLKGTYLTNYNGVIQLDSVDTDNSIVVQAKDQDLTPQVVSIEELDSSFINAQVAEASDEGYIYRFTSKLIMLENVQFTASDLENTYADVPNSSSQNVTLEDCEGHQILVRSSAYADWAADSLATGNGSMVCIVSRYGDELQLYIRSIKEVELTDSRCSGELFLKDFEDESVTSGGWTTYNVSGSVSWTTGYYSSNNYAYISNWDGSANSACESWLISPEIDLMESTAAILSFENDVNYSGPALALMVSTNYTEGTDPSTNGTWTDISSSVTWDPETLAWNFYNTGDIDLSSYIGQSIHFAFKYTGTNSTGSTWEIDDIRFIG